MDYFDKIPELWNIPRFIWKDDRSNESGLLRHFTDCILLLFTFSLSPLALDEIIVASSGAYQPAKVRLQIDVQRASNWR